MEFVKIYQIQFRFPHFKSDISLKFAEINE
jgi:hypothetical protein